MKTLFSMKTTDSKRDSLELARMSVVSSAYCLNLNSLPFISIPLIFCDMLLKSYMFYLPHFSREQKILFLAISERPKLAETERSDTKHLVLIYQQRGEKYTPSQTKRRIKLKPGSSTWKVKNGTACSESYL